MPTEEFCECSSKQESVVFPKSLQESIDRIIKEEGYITSDVSIRMFSTGGANYMGDLYEVDIKGKTPDGDKETNIFVKKRIISNEANSFVPVTQIYATECFFYKEISKIFTELQEEAKVPLEERYKVPQSYDESNIDAILLENLAKKGFKIPFRMDVMPLKYAELSMEQLAKFHGLFFVIEKKRPEYFNTKLKTMATPLQFDTFATFINSFCKITKENLENPMYKEKVEKLMPIFLEKYPKYMQLDPSVMCAMSHGDFRSSNVLMKEIDGEVVAAVPVDYQSLAYGTPVLDLIFFLFTSSDRQFRKNYLHHLKDLYHESLGNFLKYFDMDVETIYPKKQFQSDFANRLDFGLMMAVFGYPIIFVQEKDAPDFSKDDIATVNFKPNELFQERMIGVLDDFTEWGYI